MKKAVEGAATLPLDYINTYNIYVYIIYIYIYTFIYILYVCIRI